MNRQELTAAVERGWRKVLLHARAPIRRIQLSEDLYSLVQEEVERGEDPFRLGTPVILCPVSISTKSELILYTIAVQPIAVSLENNEIEAVIARLEAEGDASLSEIARLLSDAMKGSSATP